MSKNRTALAARNRRKSSLKAFSHKLFGGLSIACLLAGSGWTVYSKIIAASAYPTLGASYDEPVARPKPQLAMRNASEAVSEAFAALPDPAPTVANVSTVAAIKPSMALFNERFAAAGPEGVESNAANGAPPLPRFAEVQKPAESPKPAASPKLAEAPKKESKPIQLAMVTPKQQLQPAQPQQSAAEASTPKPAMSSLRAMTERAKAAVLSITGERHSIQEKLWGKPEQQNGGLLAYASADANFTASISQQDPTKGGQAPYDRSTAVYDISAKTVYLPDGTKLEAHSGLGSDLDDPGSARVKMRGVTPPHIYELKPREALFHGVPALRLNPIGGSEAIYGREGLLAHTFMLGPNGDSNGCVSFKDYYAFLDAYKTKGIRKLAVVARVY
jgi:Tlde1 domain